MLTFEYLSFTCLSYTGMKFTKRCDPGLRNGALFLKKKAVKYHIMHGFRNSTLFKRNSSNHFKDLHNLKLLKNFDVNLR